ncbi:MAG: YceI family protein [Mycobacterium sp.]
MKRLLWIVGIVIVVVVALVAAGPWLYREFIAGEADPELSLPTQTQAATTDINGTWTVVPGRTDEANHTQAGYRVDEVLRGSALTVNGRTTKVSGEAMVAASKLETAAFTIDVASIASPESSRDDQFRGMDIMDVEKFPTADVRVAQPVDLAAVPETGASVTVDVPVGMTIKGVTRDVTAKVDIQRAGDTVIAAGSVPVSWTDFGVTPPVFAGFVKVQPTGTIEFLVNLAKK